MDYVIRKMEISDCTGVQHVVTIAWNETYKGIVPDNFLEELYHNENVRIQREVDDFDIHNNHCFVLEFNHDIIGFVRFGKSFDDKLENCGEIYALYILKKYQGNGYGKILVNKAINELKNMGFNKMIIACLKGNPTNEFYKHISGKYLKDGLFQRLQLPENIYYYDI